MSESKKESVFELITEAWSNATVKLAISLMILVDVIIVCIMHFMFSSFTQANLAGAISALGAIDSVIITYLLKVIGDIKIAHKEIEKQELAAKEEIENSLQAIKSDISSLCKALKTGGIFKLYEDIENSGKFPEDSCYIFANLYRGEDFFVVYNKMSEKLGLFNPAEAEKIILFYNALHAARDRAGSLYSIYQHKMKYPEFEIQSAPLKDIANRVLKALRTCTSQADALRINIEQTSPQGNTPMTTPQSTRHHVQCPNLGPCPSPYPSLSPVVGLHHMSYQQWGAADNPKVLVCVHGLTRNSHDFDFLAAALSNDYRVICPDVVGRGQSDWLKNPAGYALPQYVNDMLVLLARLDVEAVDWFGTSMGGLIGMSLASLPGTPVRRLILNDVGPLIQASALKRIGDYVGQPPVWADTAAALAGIKQLFAPFGLQTEAEWQYLLQHTLRPLPEGGYTLNYDPAIAEPYRQTVSEQDISLWPMYEAVRCPVLAVRGENSDLLSRETWLEMQQRGPKAEPLEIAATGHAPMFTRAPEIEQIRKFLQTAS